MDEVIEISPSFGGRLPRFQLLERVQAISIWIPVSDSPNEILFKLSSAKFELSASIVNGCLTLARNGNAVSMTLNDAAHDPGWCHVIIQWSPTFLEIVVNAEPKRMQTPPTFAPFELIQWARREAIAPMTTYSDATAFRSALVNGIVGLNDKIKTADMQNAFWDFTYEGQRVVARRPKREVHVQPTIYGLLYDLALAKSLSIFPEAKSAGGFLDFLVTATLADGTTCKACVEFKLAHSDDIERGLLEQLPEYMQTHGTSIGIYCVPWFKGEYFDKPAAEFSRLKFELMDKAAKAGYNSVFGVEIDILFIDVSGSTAPSRSGK